MTGQALVTLNKVTEKAFLSNENYATVAEYYIKKFIKGSNKYGRLSTSKLRGIYALIMNVYTKINVPEDYDKYRSDIEYLKVRMAYEAGREPAVKDFLEATTLVNALSKVGSYDQFMLFCRYAESLVAYFKFHGRGDE